MDLKSKCVEEQEYAVRQWLDFYRQPTDQHVSMLVKKVNDIRDMHNPSMESKAFLRKILIDIGRKGLVKSERDNAIIDEICKKYEIIL